MRIASLLVPPPTPSLAPSPVPAGRGLAACLLLAAAAAAAAGCGSSAKPAEAPTPTPTVWKDMDLEQRTAYMKDVVMPRTKAAFVAFDGKYADMDCETCHGAGVEAKTFEMPNPDIAPLPNSEEAFGAWLAKDAEAARITPFMADTLEPLMAELLQETVFDPKTMTGEFGCMACHTLVDAAGNRVTLPPTATP